MNIPSFLLGMVFYAVFIRKNVSESTQDKAIAESQKAAQEAIRQAQDMISTI